MLSDRGATAQGKRADSYRTIIEWVRGPIESGAPVAGAQKRLRIRPNLAWLALRRAAARVD